MGTDQTTDRSATNAGWLTEVLSAILAITIVACLFATPAFAQNPPDAVISMVISPATAINTGQVVTVTHRMASYNGSTEVDAYNFVVLYDKTRLSFVPGSFFLGTASGADQQWLTKSNQESAAQGFLLHNSCDSHRPGEVGISVADLGLVYPERGVVSGTGFLVSYQLRAINPGTTFITPVPYDDGSVLLNRSSRPFGSVSFNSGTVTVRELNGAPSVTLTAPSEGGVFSAGAKVPLAATATSTNSTVVLVNFYADGANYLGADLTAPYALDWTNAPLGVHTLTAVALDANEVSVSSAAIHITVNGPPGVTITSPAGGAIFSAPASIPINVTATDSDGSVTQVLFYAGASLLGIDTSSPYVFTWSNVSTGSYSLTARAVDNRGATNISATVGIQVRPSNSPPVMVAAGALLESEGGPVTGGLDPGEAVTVRFFVRNTGGSDVANLSATLQPSGGVVSPAPSGAQSYGAVLAGGRAVGMPFTFQASGSAGGSVTATLSLQNGATSLGNLAYTFMLGSSTSYLAAGAIIIPAGGSTSTGAASIYPSSINVSALAGLVGKATIVFSNLTHSFPSDIDAMVTGPGGGKVMLMSDAGASYAISSNVLLAFDDAAGGALPQSAPITTGAYRPTDHEAGEAMPGSAPAGPYGTSLSVFQGRLPNATWSLYVADDERGDSGRIDNGWILNLTLFDPVNPVADLGVSITDTPDPVGLGSNVTWTVTVTNHGTEAALGVLLTNALPSGVTLVSSGSSQGSCVNGGSSVNCDLGFLAANAAATVTMMGTVTTIGTKSLTATLAGPSMDFNVTNNSATSSSAVSGAADLAVTATDAPDPILLGGLLSYFITVSNRGPNHATGVAITNLLPAGVSYFGASPSQGGCTLNGNVLTCTLGTISNAAQATIGISVITPNTPGVLASRVGVSSNALPDLVSGNNHAVVFTTNAHPTINLIASTALLLSESGPVTGGLDAGETVTMIFYLRNIGTVNSTNLVATLLATGGVTSPDGPRTYGALVAGAAGTGRTNTFTVTGTSGGTLTATLSLQDGSLDLGTVTFTFVLGNTLTFANLNLIGIPLFGAGTPYPSTITVSNFSGVVRQVTVTLTNLAHTYPDDIDILLVGPGNQRSLLLSDVGGSVPVSGITLVLADAATNDIANSGPLVSGTYKPTNFDDSDDEGFYAPAPAGPHPASLSSFIGADPNGTWSLYIVDGNYLDQGALGGWYLSLITGQPVNPLPSMLLSPTIHANGRPQFILMGALGDLCEIQASTNLVQWMAVSTNTLTSTTLLWMDTNAAPDWSPRFYRAWRRP